MGYAVFLDALVVMMFLLPAVLQLPGRTTWALPSWLDQRLPRGTIKAGEQHSARPAPPSSPEPAFDVVDAHTILRRAELRYRRASGWCLQI
jgi:hypothetical protein